jgi:hypothetical protein
MRHFFDNYDISNKIAVCRKVWGTIRRTLNKATNETRLKLHEVAAILSAAWFSHGLLKKRVKIKLLPQERNSFVCEVMYKKGQNIKEYHRKKLGRNDRCLQTRINKTGNKIRIDNLRQPSQTN